MTDFIENEKEHHFFTASIGHFAYEYVKRSESAKIMGTTSHGVFLSLPFNKVVFLTADVWRGPLSINLNRLPTLDLRFQSSNVVEINFPILRSENIEIEILENSHHWMPKAIRFNSRNRKQIFVRSHQLCRYLGACINEADFSQVLSVVADDESDGRKEQQIAEYLEIGFDPIETRDLPVAKFIGKGRGLTPAGDDFVIGFLIARHFLHRADNNLQELVEFAQVKTTSLSASLIECAAEGSADERLLNALDYLLNGEGDLYSVKKELLSYGSSSGMETLAGMISAVYLDFLN